MYPYCLFMAVMGCMSHTAWSARQYSIIYGTPKAHSKLLVSTDNWDHYQSTLMAQPVLTKGLTSFSVYLLGDWTAQVCGGRASSCWAVGGGGVSRRQGRARRGRDG